MYALVGCTLVLGFHCPQKPTKACFLRFVLDCAVHVSLLHACHSVVTNPILGVHNVCLVFLWRMLQALGSHTVTLILLG
jgi:hypothetical protein